ncbi:MAG: hypothetical protein J6C42_04015 [Clostridia bacterium]|nr:hypothetical protein [Clostridia bacterium]
MAVIHSTIQHKSGIALGGIGTGSVELFPDGEFHQWQIANAPRWATVCGDAPVDDGENNTGALSFWVRTEAGNAAPVVRKLGMKTDAEDFTYRIFAWNKPVEAISFNGRFPVCDLTYEDRALPVKVSMRAIAPFVPHHTEDSATPGFYLDFTLTNPSDTPMTVSLRSVLEPNFCNARGCVNERYTDGEVTGIYLTTPPVRPWEEVPRDANYGTLCYSAEGGEISYITADYFRFLREYVASGSFGVSQESVLFGFRKTGELPNTTSGNRPSELPRVPEDCTDEALDRYIAEYTGYPFAQSILHRIRHLNPAFPETRTEKAEFLRVLGRSVDRIGDNFGSCALCSKVALAAGETRTVRFVLSWYFPNHYGKFGNRLGHWYENRFSDAREANRYLVAHRADIAGKAAAFAELLYNTDLPEMYPDAWSVHLSTLVKDSWYLKDGKFGLWEGLGYCGFHTTDITYHASFGLLALFPDLQKRQMEMGLAFQREDGRVHHFFTPDLEHVDNGFERVDMNNQFVLMVCRDYLCTGDRAYLERMWIPVRKAMDSIQALDADGDGLPDHGTTRNTYDAWNFSGSPTYICVLWLSALKAAARIAGILGEDECRTAWETLLEKGLAALEERLWNGTYYNLWRRDDETGTVIDGSLMTDQIDGEWFLRMSGLEGNLSEERVRTVLQTIMEGNFDPEDGLINATCPEGRPVSLQTYENCQAGAVWTGIGYAVAALAMTVGMSDMADILVGSIHENQMRFGQFWEHWECGFRYTRPMSSWTTLIAAAGLSVDQEQKTLCLRPIRPKLTVPLCTGDFLGTVVFDGERCTVTALEGTLEGWTIDVPETIKTVTLK